MSSILLSVWSRTFYSCVYISVAHCLICTAFGVVCCKAYASFWNGHHKLRYSQAIWLLRRLMTRTWGQRHPASDRSSHPGFDVFVDCKPSIWSNNWRYLTGHRIIVCIISTWRRHRNTTSESSAEKLTLKWNFTGKQYIWRQVRNATVYDNNKDFRVCTIILIILKHPMSPYTKTSQFDNAIIRSQVRTHLCLNVHRQRPP